MVWIGFLRLFLVVRNFQSPIFCPAEPTVLGPLSISKWVNEFKLGSGYIHIQPYLMWVKLSAHHIVESNEQSKQYFTSRCVLHMSKSSHVHSAYFLIDLREPVCMEQLLFLLVYQLTYVNQCAWNSFSFSLVSHMYMTRATKDGIAGSSGFMVRHSPISTDSPFTKTAA